MWIILLTELLLLTGLYIASHRKYASTVREYKAMLKLPILAQASLYLVDRFQLMERLPTAAAKIHLTMNGLYDRKSAWTRSKLFAADTAGVSAAVLPGATALGIAADGDPLFLLYGLIVSSVLPFLLYKELAKQLERKKRRMLIELPEMLSQMTLLVNAGETVLRALSRCVETHRDKDSDLIRHLAQAVHELQMNASFPKTMEDFSKRCALQEVSMFTTTLLLNYKRGGDDLVLALGELSAALWEKRKAVARTLGEEASSKLVFPMVLIFLVVMIVTAAPALFLMSG